MSPRLMRRKLAPALLLALLAAPAGAQIGALGGIVGLPGIGKGLGPYLTMTGDTIGAGKGAFGYNYYYMPLGTYYGDRLDRVFRNQRAVFQIQAFEADLGVNAGTTVGIWVPMTSWEVRTVDPTTAATSKEHDGGLSNPRLIAKAAFLDRPSLSGALRGQIILPSGYAVGTDALGALGEIGVTYSGLPVVDLHLNPGYVYSGRVRGVRLTDLGYVNAAASSKFSDAFGLFAELNYFTNLRTTQDTYARQLLDAQGNLAFDPATGKPLLERVSVNLYESRLDLTPGAKMMVLDHLIVTAAMPISLYNVYKLGYRYEYIGALHYVF